MVSSILKQAAEILRRQKESKRWRKTFLCLAVAVTAATVAILMMTGQALTRRDKVLNCQLEIHEHTEDCYDEEDNLICGYADYVVHVHNDDCYDSEKNLICALPEKEVHEHTEYCYEEQEVLICGMTEEAGANTDSSEAQPESTEADTGTTESTDAAGTAGHTHTDECYAAEQGGLSCGMEEHTHGDGCYEESLVCDLGEHSHDDSCYDEEGNLTCGEDEYSHDGGCYEQTLVCELEEHTHTDNCYEQTRTLICTLEEGAAPSQNADAGSDEPKGSSAGADTGENTKTAGHIHTAECYKTEKVLTCGELELHTHEKSLIEDGGCYDESAFDEETGDFIEGSRPVCGLLQLEEHIHGEECFLPAEGETVPAEYTKTYEDDSFKITAAYTAEANIPEEAQLIAEQITAEGDGEHYAEREAQYRETVESENATMWALLKIGFYVEDEESKEQKEIEPEAPVTITVQMLDEEGMPEGAPVTVVHFGEEDSEVLDGGRAENGSTTFQLDSFSEIAIGYCPDEDGSIYISKSFLYEDDSYHIVFRVEGDAAPAEGEEALPEGVADVVSEEIQPVKVAGNSTQEAPVPEEEPSLPNDEAQNPSPEEEPLLPDDETQDSSPADEPTVPDGEAPEPSPEEDPPENADGTLPEEAPADTEAADRLQFCLEQMAEGSEEYETYAAFTEDREDGSQQINLQVLKYSVTYDDIELDLSYCKVTAEIRPTQTLIDYAKSGLSEAPSSSEGDTAENGNQELMLSALQMTDEVEVLNSLVVEAESKDAKNAENTDNAEQDNTIIVDLGNGNSFAIDLTGTPNPHFSVQYYAWLDRANLMTERPADDNKTYTLWGKPKEVLQYLELIDTSAESNDGKAKLPTNGAGTPKTAYLELENKSTGGKVKTEPKLTKIYSDRTDFEYYKQPTIEYLNAAIVNDHYKLKEIWVLRDGKKADSTDAADWKVYTYSDNLHLTNRNSDKVAAEGSDSGYVYVTDNTVIRLVYDVSTTENDSFDAAFYDYDISDHKTSGYIDTAKGGINSTLPNGLNTGAYAFGNQNCGTAFGYGVKWNGNKLNAGNNTGNGGTNTFKGCTFGLVTDVKSSSDGKGGKTVVFSNGVQGPEIFGTTDLTGKYQYPGTLSFNRSGDTYTLNAAQGEGGISANNLNRFIHPKTGSTTYKHIWTNNFWPMDNVQNHDIHFGGGTTKYCWGIAEKINGFDANNKIAASAQKALPASDDGKDHNSFFGMSYTVNFELVKDYEGPLEYYFFGDDDMWVFLDDEKLVCDIGGVHSSVGQYVNLWDYLKVNTSDTPEKHTLSFFYTERGASGSTCWMQFTLPSVSSLTPQTTGKNYGELRIDKTVVKKGPNEQPISYDTGDEFVFAIKLTDADGKPVADDYAFTKYNADGKPVNKDANGLVLRDGSAFTLKNGQYIVIDHLRAGTKYTIVELDKVLENPDGKKDLVNSDYVYDTDVTITDTTLDKNGNPVQGKPTTTADTKNADGTIPTGGLSQVQYTNEFRAYALPRTGGMGTAGYTGTGVLLTFIAVISCFGYKRRKSIRGEE